MKNVCEKHGRLYYRRKAGGRDFYIRLPALTDPTFAEAYARVSAPDKARLAAARGSIGALVQTYRSSAEFKNVRAEATRKNYERYLAMIDDAHGHRSVAGVRPAHVYKMRDDLADTPGKANNYLSVFRMLMTFATKRDWRADNPASKVPALALGEHEPWPAEVLEKALAAASPMLRLALVTGLCSGQRIGDVILMQHGWHDGAIMELTQGKTGKDVAIPMHGLWLAELTKLERRAVTLLYDRQGKPFGSEEAVQARIRTLMKAIGVTGYSFHGLRKNACCYLTEIGLADTEIGSILVMSPKMVRHYGKRANALMIARNVAHRVIRGDVLRLPGGRSTRGA